MVVIFCKNCKNLMQTQHEDNESNLQCLSCLGNNPIINNTISNVVYKESKIINEYHVNLNTKYDRTLMRTRDQECKNPDCPSKNSSENPLVISYSRNKDLIQGYMCTICDACWY